MPQHACHGGLHHEWIKRYVLLKHTMHALLSVLFVEEAGVPGENHLVVLI